MNLSDFGLTSAKVPSSVPTRRAAASASQLLAACRGASKEGHALEWSLGSHASSERDQQRLDDTNPPKGFLTSQSNV